MSSYKYDVMLNSDGMHDMAVLLISQQQITLLNCCYQICYFPAPIMNFFHHICFPNALIILLHCKTCSYYCINDMMQHGMLFIFMFWTNAGFTKDFSVGLLSQIADKYKSRKLTIGMKLISLGIIQTLMESWAMTFKICTKHRLQTLG